MNKKIIIKFGTESLVSKKRLNQSAFDDIARQVSQLIKEGWQVNIVTSGSVQAGREVVGSLSINESRLHKKDLAGIGTVKLTSMWSKAFARYNIAIAQIWVTHANLQHFCERESISQSLENFQQNGIVSIINANDVISSREIELMDRGISENDQLTRLIAEITNPDAILFITSVGGVYESDPRKNKNARMFKELNINNYSFLCQQEGKSEQGSGGMNQKIIEAAKCCKEDRQVVIADWQDNSICRFAKRELVGTRLGCKNTFWK